jgi:hypothetical protein
MERNEVKQHSPFITNLLNPQGSHAQGNLFLDAFLRLLNERHQTALNFDTHSCSVTTEKYIGPISEDSETGGRIDIIFQNNNGQGIIIENKIHAKNRDKQLIRYNNYGSRFNGLHLINLNLLGSAPTNTSTGGIIKPSAIISYKDDILSWLSECKNLAIDLPVIRETISQYMKTVLLLTNQNPDNKMTKEVSDIIVSTPDYLRSAIIIANSLNTAKEATLRRFVERLRLIEA